MKKPAHWAIAALLLCVSGAQGQATGNSAPVGSVIDQKPADVLSLSDFRARLKQYEEQLTEAERDSSAAGELRRSLPEKWRVQIDSGSAEVSSEELRRDVSEMQRGGEQAASGARKAKSWLDHAIVETEGLETGKPVIGAERKDREVEKIFSRVEFKGLSGPSWMDQWSARVGRWIGREIERILRAVHVPARFGNVLIWPVILITVAALAFLAWRVLRDQPVAILPEVTQDTTAPDRAWLKEAMAAAQQGEYREAVHRGYWAAIARLEQRQILTNDRTRTPRESLRLLESHPTERGILREQTVRLERLWYGCREATDADWTDALAELRQIGCL